MLEKDPDEALEGAEQRAVDHHRHVLRVVGARVGQAEALGHVVVELDGAELPRAAERVGHVQVDLRRVERALPLGDRVLVPAGAQRLLEHALGLVPEGVVAQAVVGVGPRRKLDVDREVEQRVDVVGECHARSNLVGHLVLAAEDVRVVLDEVADAQQAVQRPGRLAPVKQPGLGWRP